VRTPSTPGALCLHPENLPVHLPGLVRELQSPVPILIPLLAKERISKPICTCGESAGLCQGPMDSHMENTKSSQAGLLRALLAGPTTGTSRAAATRSRFESLRVHLREFLQEGPQPGVMLSPAPGDLELLL